MANALQPQPSNKTPAFRKFAQRMNAPDRPILKAAGLTKIVSNGAAPLVILQDIALEVMAGEALAIVGASGSGKSTLLGLLAGLDEPSSGSVHLMNREFSALDEDGRARLRASALGFVVQSFQLLAPLNALENVMLPLELAEDAQARHKAREMLERVGLGERLHHYPKHLSGGEQQRVALARAFVVRPKVLMADEPTGNLDAATGTAVIDLLFQLNAEAGTTLILVTHDESLAQRCTRRLRLVGGHMQSEIAG
jgi:putative ABC transport system ATP-binding protein